MDVALIQWPSDEALRAELAGFRRPRLLVVEPNVEPPQCIDVLEDWVRLPVSRIDRNARIRALESRAGGHQSGSPTLHGNGTLEFRGLTTHLSAIQADLVGVMLERMGAVVSRDVLGARAWPDGTPSQNTIDVSIGRLRRQLAPLGLGVRTVRSRGYLLAVGRNR